MPQIMGASKAYSGKVFSVDMPHQHVHRAYPGDFVVFNIKGLDKYTLLRSGDVMVPALHMEVPVPQIAEEIVEASLNALGRLSPGTPWKPLSLLGSFGGSGKELSRWRLRRKRRKRTRRRGGS